MYISGINYESLVDGIGVRTTIFISGCKHNCKGCHNPDTHSFTFGTLLNHNILLKVVENIAKRPFIRGITFSGGDPMYSTKELEPVIDFFRKELPHIDIWVYTGFRIEELFEMDIGDVLQKIDVLVDGMFIESLKSFNLKFRGSSNQRIIDVKNTLLHKSIKELDI